MTRYTDTQLSLDEYGFFNIDSGRLAAIGGSTQYVDLVCGLDIACHTGVPLDGICRSDVVCGSGSIDYACRVNGVCQ